MKVGIMFANVGPFGQPEPAVALAQAAEQAGFESLWTVEHVVVPVGYGSKYPYSADGKMPGPEESPIPDPLVWLSFVAGATQRIRLGTGILILPQRHPVYVAKALATLDQLSQGRLLCGIGIGWLEEEFEVVGVPFDERASRTEESVRAMRSLWAEEPSAFEGEHYRWRPVQSNPKPFQPGGVPIIVGGHVKGAARRAARIGDGYFPVSAERLPEMREALAKECERIGRDVSTIEITTGGAPTLEAARKLEDMGVSRMVVPLPGFDIETVRAECDRIGNELISKL